MNRAASIMASPSLFECHPCCTWQPPLDYDKLKLSWNQFDLSPKWLCSYFRPSGLLGERKRLICFLQKRCREPPTAGSQMEIFWFDHDYKRRASVFENEMKTPSHRPFCCFTRSWSSWVFQCSEPHAKPQQSNFFLYFSLIHQTALADNLKYVIIQE